MTIALAVLSSMPAALNSPELAVQASSRDLKWSSRRRNLTVPSLGIKLRATQYFASVMAYYRSTRRMS